MSDQDMNQQDPIQGTQETTQTDPYDELLSQIVNEEGKPKYTSVEEALKGTLHAQQHIQTLEQENSQIKTEKTRMEELINSLKPESQAATTEQAATTAPAESPTPEKTVDEEEALLQRLQEKLSAKEKARNQEANKRTALEKVQSLYADKSAEYMKEKAQSLGVSTEFLLNTAATSPQAFYSLIGLDQKQSKSFNTSSSVNTTSLSSSPNTEYTGANPMRSGRVSDAVNLWNSLQ